MNENETNCKFCSYIFDEKLLYCRTIRGSERHEKQQAERMKLEEFEKDYGGNHIFHDDVGFCIFGNSGDPFQPAGIDNVSYCPYCGRKLGDINEFLIANKELCAVIKSLEAPWG